MASKPRRNKGRSTKHRQRTIRTLIKHTEGTENLMHVGVVNPNTKRKQILENTISIVQLLKGYERLRQLRKEKESSKSEFKTKLRELNKLIKEFNLSVPRVKLPEVRGVKELKGEAKKLTVTNITEPKKIKVEKKTSTNLDKLDRDIDLLRKKLESL